MKVDFMTMIALVIVLIGVHGVAHIIAIQDLRERIAVLEGEKP